MQKTEYRNTFAISQSAIKKFRKDGIIKFKKVFIDGEQDDDDDSKYAFGSLTDTLAFEPNLIDKRFYIADDEVELPGEKVKTVVDRVFKEAQEIVANKIKLNASGHLPEPLPVPDITNIYDWEPELIRTAKAIKLGGKTWTVGRILDNLYINGANYFRFLALANGKEVITAMDNADAIEIVEVLRNNKETRPYFIQQEGEELLFQTEIFTEYAINNINIPLKGALDIIRINHNEKWIVVPDLKTIYDISKAEYQIVNYGYGIQAAFYNFLVKEWLKTYKDGAYIGYAIKNPLNIMIDRVNKIPYIYEYDWDDIDILTHGSREFKVEGWTETLKKIAWHMESGVWDRPKELYETGKVKIKIYK